MPLPDENSVKFDESVGRCRDQITGRFAKCPEPALSDAPSDAPADDSPADARVDDSPASDRAAGDDATPADVPDPADDSSPADAPAPANDSDSSDRAASEDQAPAQSVDDLDFQNLYEDLE